MTLNELHSIVDGRFPGWKTVVLNSPKHGIGVRFWMKNEIGKVQNVVLFLPDGMADM